MSATFRSLGDGTYEGFCPATGARVRVRAADQPAFMRECQAAQARQYYPVGDAIARVTSAVGIKPCTPCKQRQAALNQMFRRRS